MTEQTNDKIKKSAYFTYRNLDEKSYSNYTPPRYLSPYFEEKDKDLNILDIGCGLGQLLSNLKTRGFSHLFGIDINEESIALCRKNGLEVSKIDDIREFFPPEGRKFNRIVMSHVLEHIEKEKMVDTLIHIKQNLLSENGVFLLMVPNAQSPTGSYWRYEDFTHNIMFTAGSCIYVLKSAGFNTIHFIDPDGTLHMNPFKRIIIKTLLGYYRLKERIWHKILQTSYHSQSPNIYTFELKVAAS